MAKAESVGARMVMSWRVARLEVKRGTAFRATRRVVRSGWDLIRETRDWHEARERRDRTGRRG